MIFLLLSIKEHIMGMTLAVFMAMTEHPRKALNALVEIREKEPRMTEVTTANKMAFFGTVSLPVVVSSCCHNVLYGSPWSLPRE